VYNKKNMYIYKLTNNVNGKIYVGKTIRKNLSQYLYYKRWNASHGNRANMRVVSAIAKYGWENFSVEVLATPATPEWCEYLEILWIMMLDARNPQVGYNVHKGGGKGALGIRMSEECKRKIGNANKGRKPNVYARTEAHREQLRSGMQGNCRGVKITTELVAKWNAAMTPEQRSEKGRKAAAARWGKAA
jgi:group I intron endonuclease